MTQNVEGADSRGRRDGSAMDREKNKLFAEMEESIAMLLEYGQPLPKPPPRRHLPREKNRIKIE
ncbi:hypothetical protein ANCCAN_13217 [Ancylostoma caninum]|uniref:Uncharacterized protein n=1 Tax=Ancylostoma caninum TaxID=29170 RepID=A0A368GAW8_ANCCA|nr:hypothetical protein ANCCAN_13217 [Ancylostoma caninum]